MSDSTAAVPHILAMLGLHKIKRLIRSQLCALAVLCLTAAIAPQAVAQVCGPNITLTAGQWSLVGVPCEPPNPGNTIVDVFGDSLNSAAGAPNYGYNSTWVAYKKGYDGQCVGATDPNNCYIKLTTADTVSAGDAFWIFTDLAATLDFDAIGASPTSPGFSFQAQASVDATSRFYLFANPYASTVNWSDLRFTGSFLNVFPTDFSTQEAVDAGTISTVVQYWSGNDYYPLSLISMPDTATFKPKESAWIEFEPLSVLWLDTLTVQVPDPNSP